MKGFVSKASSMDTNTGSLGPSRWSHRVLDNIHWLNNPMHEDFAEAHLAVC